MNKFDKLVESVINEAKTIATTLDNIKVGGSYFSSKKKAFAKVSKITKDKIIYTIDDYSIEFEKTPTEFVKIFKVLK